MNGAMQDIHDKYFVGAAILPELLTDQYYRANGCGHHLGAKRDYFCVSATDCPVFMGWNGSVTHKHVMRGWVAGISNKMDIGMSAPCAAPPAPSLKAGSQTTSIRYAGVITTYAGSNVRVLGNERVCGVCIFGLRLIVLDQRTFNRKTPKPGLRTVWVWRGSMAKAQPLSPKTDRFPHVPAVLPLLW